MSGLLFVALLAAAVPRPPDPAGALVLRIDGRDAYFDLGREAGGSPGVRVLFFRTVSVLDPRTGATVKDRFLVTEAEIAEAGEVLSRARLDPEVSAHVRVGDRVELLHPKEVPPPLVRDVSPPEPARKPAREARPGKPAKEDQATALKPARDLEQGAPPAQAGPAELTPEQKEADEFRDAFVRAQQLSAPVRIAFWTRWVKEHAGGPLSTAISLELDMLKLADAPRAVAQSGPPAPPLPRLDVPEIAAPATAFDGDPVEVVLTYPGAPPEAATLNWRPRGFPLYETLRFTPDGQHALRASLPVGATPPPGVEWWAGVIDNGAERPIAGSGPDPRTVTIATAPGLDIPTRKDRSRGTLWIYYADWNRFKGNDWYIDVEGEMLYRVLSGLHSIRMGFGLYQGQGQSLQSAINDEKNKVPYQSTAFGYHYGYTELEFHPGEMFGVMGKLLTGVDRSGFGAGFEGRIRIGREDGTNLVLGSGFTKGIGNKNDLTLSWDRVQGFPMSASVIVTNEPVMADYGVRFLYQVGRSVTDFCDLSLRLSYQLRDINHNGFGAGLSASFHW
jgi:hypothetical protein